MTITVRIADVSKLKTAAQALTDRGFLVTVRVIDQWDEPTLGASYLTTNASNWEVYQARSSATL